VEDIVNEWDRELDLRAQAFVRHAQALADWDRRILLLLLLLLTNRHSLLALEEQLAKARRPPFGLVGLLGVGSLR